jgi:hypothetical protein
MTAYTIDIVMPLEKGKRLTQKWWAERYAAGATRAGGMPAEVAEPAVVRLRREDDPETGERYVRATFPMPAETGIGRTRELAHMLTSVLHAEGHTIRLDGEKQETVPGEVPAELVGHFGGVTYHEANVTSERCLTCVFCADTRIGCCGEGMAWSLADIGAVLLTGDFALVQRVLALPGQMDGVKWHPYLSAGKCVFHDPSCGCTLQRDRMPLQCRTYLCAPEQLLPAHLLANYTNYVDMLEEAEAFIEDHMREESGVDFSSPLPQLLEAAEKAFAAWDAYLTRK